MPTGKSPEANHVYEEFFLIPEGNTNVEQRLVVSLFTGVALGQQIGVICAKKIRLIGISEDINAMTYNLSSWLIPLSGEAQLVQGYQFAGIGVVMA